MEEEMPPKVKINKEEIVEKALELLKTGGESAINARNIAKALNCSTQPIFSNFTDMKELQNAVISRAYEVYTGFLKREVESGKYPAYKSFGMAYIRFAKEETQLFKLLFMCDRKGEKLKPSPDFNQSVEMIMQANGVTREQAQTIHFETWVCVHGIATMVATCFLTLEWEEISQILTDVYQGLRAKFIK